MVHHRILIADSYVDAADSLGLLLRLWGHDVRVCHSGQEALQAAAEQPPEVALLELVLAGLDGCEVARRLHAGHNRLPLVAVTGFSDEAHRTLSRECGFRHHLVKPVDPRELQTLLDDLLADPPAD